MIALPPVDRVAGLPVPLTPFVGREREVERVLDLLRSPPVRLLTLTGPGGVGKTRLALRAAEAVAGDFPDEVAFVPLATVSDPDLVIGAIGQALGLRESGDHPRHEVLATYLRDRRLLLVLDNFERVVGAAPLAASLLAACPWLKVLVTSRVTLRVSGEQEFPVLPLALPDSTRLPPVAELESLEAIALFVQRARAVKPDFLLTADNAAAVAAICHRLDGLPLAIELAAARSKVLSPAALAARLTNRLQLLTSGPQDQPVRLQTMSAAIAWSYDLLTVPEQALFRRLAVFVGGFTLEAAEAVGGEAASRSEEEPLTASVLEVLASLVDKSLLQHLNGGEEDVRFWMLETIREYGLERLREAGEDKETRRRHARWCVGVAERAEAGFRGAVEASWLDRVDAEHDNLSAGLGWLEQTGDSEMGLRLSGALWGFWYVRSYRAEGRGWLERALARGTEAPPAVRAKALVGLGELEQALGDVDRGAALLSEGLALRRKLGDAWGTAEALLLLGAAVQKQGAYDRATSLFEEAEALFRLQGNESWVAIALYHLGVLAYAAGDAQRAVTLLTEALVWNREHGDLWGAAVSLGDLGLVASERGDYQHAAALFAESLGLWQTLGTKEGAAAYLANVATLLTARGQLQPAARLFGAAHAVSEALGYAFELPARASYERAVAILRGRLDEDMLAAAWNAGRGLALEQAVAEAAELPSVGALPTDGTAAPSHTAAPHGLTPREIEVLHRLVAGRTDREIAEDLFISPRTAQGHVGSVYGKLGVNSRAAAVAAAMRAGLLEGESPA